jgi:hypothetical protein
LYQPSIQRMISRRASARVANRRRCTGSRFIDAKNVSPAALKSQHYPANRAGDEVQTPRDLAGFSWPCGGAGGWLRVVGVVLRVGARVGASFEGGAEVGDLGAGPGEGAPVVGVGTVVFDDGPQLGAAVEAGCG